MREHCLLLRQVPHWSMGWWPGLSTLSDRLMSSWARQRLVAASSRSTDEKVALRSGSGRHWRRASRARALSLKLDRQSGSRTSAHIPQEAAHDVLEEADRLVLDELGDHVAEHGADGEEALVRLADVGEADVVEQDLLHDEDGDRLAELGARLHDAQAQRDDLGREQEVDHLGRVVLDQRADDAQRRQAQVLERPRARRRVEERV